VQNFQIVALDSERFRCPRERTIPASNQDCQVTVELTADMFAVVGDGAHASIVSLSLDEA